MKTFILALMALLSLSSSVSALERFHYDVKFGILKAGEAEITFDKKEKGYDFLALAWTTLSLFNMKERIAVRGEENFIPTDFQMHQIENDYRAHKTLTFNGDDTATYQKAGSPEETYQIYGAKRDYMSQLFRLRVQKEDIKVGDIIDETVMGMNGAYQMQLKVLAKESVYSPATKWTEAYVLQPVLKRLPEGKVNKDWRIFISADKKRIPLRIEAKLKFGSFKAILKNIGDEKTPSKAPKGLQSGAMFTKY